VSTAQNQPTPAPAPIHPEAHQAVREAFSGPTPPTPHSDAVTITPEVWQGLLATFGPVLVGLMQAVIARISGGGNQPARP
jgi:hypothetical protein